MCFVYAGNTRAMVIQEWRRIAPEALIYVARGAPHDIDNDSAADLSFAWIVTRPAWRNS